MSTCPNCSTKIEKEDAVYSYGFAFHVHFYTCDNCKSKFRDYIRRRDGQLSYTLLQKCGTGHFKKAVRK